jgi:serine/threonine protein kinase
MRWLSDSALRRLQDVADWPDLSGTKYEAVEKIDRGGMGTVYRARDRELERDVALKVLSIPDPGERAAARVLREARILARLEHPAIVPVHDVGRLPDGRVYYVMKLVRGSRLDVHLRDVRPALVERLRIFQRICEAVGFAHAQGIVHRDLKPENVMVGPFGEVLVMDWGVAKILDEPLQAPEQVSTNFGSPDPSAKPEPATAATVSPATTHGTVLGTPGYMAPEQARGDADRVDGRADVYSLGAILCFMATGVVPAAASAAETGGSRSGRGHDIPRPLRAIFLRALAARPEDRYAAVGDLATDVWRFLARAPVDAYREGVLDRLRRVAGKYRVPILLVAAYLLMRVLLLVWARR